jgi:PAS domain S-box-containing protein
MLTVEELKKGGVQVNTITLEPLSQVDINRLVADTLSCPLELAQPLTELVYQKTKGNPFFTTQFLKALHDDKFIKFNQDLGYWKCDISQIRVQSLTDDVVEFMAIQLQKLSPETQDVLKLAACIGSQFNLQTLGIVYERSETETATALWRALQEGLIIPINESYKFFQAGTESSETTQIITVPYRFLHDRIQQAAYSLIPEDQKQPTHLLIGRLLLKSTSDSETDANIFEIVNHWNDAIDLIVDPLERMKLAELNLTAGQKAKSSAAYESTLKYFNTGISLLPHNGWQTQYDLALALYTAGAESALLYGDYPQMDALIEAVLHHAKEILDTIKVYKVKIQGSIVQNQQQDCLDTGLSVLQQLGVPLETQPPNRVESIQELIHLPEMHDPYKLAATDILIDVITPAWTLNPEIFQQTIFTLVNLSFTYGHCPATAFGYAWYGTFLCETLGDIDSGYQFGLLALRLLDEFDANGLRSSVNDLFATHIGHWKDHTRTTLPFHLEGLRHGLETGNLEYAGYGAAEYCQYLFLVGESLDTVEEKCRYYLALIQKLQLKFHILYLAPWQQGVMNLRRDFDGQSTQLIGECYDEREHLQRIAEENQLTLGFCNFFVKALLCFLFADYEKAIEYSYIALQNRAGVFGTYFIPTTVFYASLSLLANYSNAESIQQQQYHQKIAENLLVLKTCATDAPMNHQHKYDLVKAEYCRVLGQNHKAIDLYDRAIAGAKANEYLQEEALANELAAKFYLEWGKEKVAAGYMQEAYYCYAKWGAKAKTDDLEIRYPQLLQPILQKVSSTLSVFETLATLISPTNFSQSSTSKTSANKSSSSHSLNEVLDLAALLQVSQAISSTIDLDELLQTLSQAMLKTSGGDRCVLLLCQDNQWQVRAIANLQETILESVSLENNSTLPIKLIQYIKNTSETIVINNLTTDLPGIVDDYLHQYQPKSVLGLPIINQGNLVGILYLENSLVSDIFTSDRLLALNFLATQAAISLENARLYHQVNQALQDIQYKEAQSRGIFEAVADGLLITNLETGRVMDANPAYCQMHGYSYSEILQLNPLDFIPPDRHDKFDSFLTTVKIGQEFTCESVCKRPDGTPFDIEIKSVPFWYNGNHCGLSVIRDVTERKQMELSIQEKNRGLEQAMTDLQQAQIQVIQSEKMSALGNLVAGVAHEINNPVGCIVGNTSVVQNYINDLLGVIDLYGQKFPQPGAEVQEELEAIDLEYLREDLPKLVKSMKDGGDRIRDISASLRIFSRADSDQKQKFNLHEGIDSTILILRHRLKANDQYPEIEVITNYGNIPTINCFPGQLNQVFMNILANAIDALDESSQGRSYEDIKAAPNRITINTFIEDNYVRISIKDNGIGMPEEIKNQIFDHLFTTKEIGKGTGLGLAIARQIVEEKHQGTINVNSKLGQGTEFIITLPISAS